MDNLSNNMVIDGADFAENDEPQDVALIHPNSLEDDVEDEADSEPPADDYEASRARVLPELPDLEVEVEGHFTWDIEDWRRCERKTRSPVFKVGDTPWRILFFPQGNNVEYASFYLEHGFEDKPPEDWSCCVQFSLMLWNPNDPTIKTSHTATHRFNPDEGDWGFTRFAELRKLFMQPWEGKGRPMVENDSAKMTAYVRIIKDETGVLWHNFINYDSKKETGFVGLRNQGATCYLNSLLQSLYFTNAFRKAVYMIPTEKDDSLKNSAYTLQRLFYQLQTSADAVSTTELTKSFGWETRHIFEQQDVQELSRKLMERLEEKMKGTAAESALPDLFVGKTKTYVSCINVDYESSRIEDFWDIQLNVSGNKNLDDSFKNEIQVEIMEGENKYFAEGYGLQDAKKGVAFESFPNVLHLQLKRFEYDINRDAMMKVNDRYEFPEIFDATPYLSEDADRSEPYIYQLHGVLVHSGDSNAGHYYAFLKPTKDGHFYKFDDDRVTRATHKEIFEENFGGDYPAVNGNLNNIRNPYTRTISNKRSMSAYMLVYLRQSRIDQILQPVELSDCPSHLQKKLEQERVLKEQKRKERDEQHLYLNVKVISDQNFLQHQGFDLAPWDQEPGESPAAPASFRTLKTTTIGEFATSMANELEVPDEHVRLWVMVNRQNKTVRPDQPLLDNDMTIEEAYAKHGTKTFDFRLWVEVADTIEGGKAVWPELAPQNANPPILIFLKQFDPETQTLRGLGHIYAHKNDKVVDLHPQVQQLKKWGSNVGVKLFEEIKPSMIEQMKSKQSLNQAEIQDGDIICFQKALSDKEIAALTQNGKYIDAREFYDHLLNRIMIKFMPVPDGEQGKGSFEIELGKKMSYDQFAAKVGDYLSVEASHIRFYTVNAATGNKKAPVRRQVSTTLSQILAPAYSTYGSNQHGSALFFEVLDRSLSELETMKKVKLNWLSEGLSKEEIIDVLVVKNGTLSDLIPNMQKKLNLSEDTAENIRFYEAHSNKFNKEYRLDYPVTSLSEFLTLYAERIPEEELQATEDDLFIPAFHFQKEPSKTHSVPFKFLVKPGEVFKDTKVRLEKRLGIKGKQFEKIKFAVIQRLSYSKPRYLEDNDVLSDLVNESDDALGLDHPDKARPFWSRADPIFIK